MPRLGQQQSPETRAKISAANTGKIRTPEMRAQWSAAHRGQTHVTSSETKGKISAANTGKIRSPEMRAANSAARVGRGLGSLNHDWRGGLEVSVRRSEARRRNLGYIYLNAWFVGCDGHHVDTEQVIHIPHALHHSIWHCQRTGRGMETINVLAFEFLAEQRSPS